MTMLRMLWERASTSMFWVPALFIGAGLGLARALTWVDESFDLDGVPVIIDSTADGARALLATAAGATITVAGIVFSVTVVALQLASSQFSPRVLGSFLRDRFSQVVMGIVVGTFSYSLAVLAVTRTDTEGSGFGFIVELFGPDRQRRLAVTVALGLAVLSVVAIVAFIDHSARSMQVGRVIRRVADRTRERIQRLHPAAGTPREAGTDTPLPDGESHRVSSRNDGWVQAVDAAALRRAVPPNGVLRLDTRVGAFIARDLPLATVWPPPADPDRWAAQVRTAVKTGRSRTLDQDVEFGIRQLVDIALRALSPGINDPTTANEVLVHLTGIVREILLRDLPPRVVPTAEGGTVYLPHDLDRAAYVRAAFREIRVAAAHQPAVLLTLVQVLVALNTVLADADLAERGRPLRREAALVVAGLDSAELLEEDLEPIRAAAAGLVDEGS